ncbi:MAG: dihydrofolate reductase [Oscillospiraceae bacterium]|nr:dihydrofolate reductase [Oscillospiraceae bacterium]
MNAIAAVSSAWGIGYQNDLLFHISPDLKRFRALTAGGTLIMGRKTFDSLPGGKPLPKRRHIILTRSPDFFREGIETAHSLEEAFRLTADSENVWVCGGGEIYAAFLPYCSRCYLTHVDADPPCDTYFPKISDNPDWRVLEEQAPDTDGIFRYQFIDYMNRTPEKL